MKRRVNLPDGIERVIDGLDDEIDGLDALRRASLRLLARAEASDDARVLLAADALVTWACEYTAETDPERLADSIV